MLETTSAALQEERAAHAETRQQLAEAHEQFARLSRQHQEAEALAKARADQLKELSSQLQSTTSTNSRSRAVIESLEQERAALLRGIAAVQSHDRQRVTTCQVSNEHAAAAWNAGFHFPVRSDLHGRRMCVPVCSERWTACSRCWAD